MGAVLTILFAGFGLAALPPFAARLVLAFNLTFFIQELFLVLPKALQLAAFRPSDLVGKGQPPTAVAPMLLAALILLAAFQLLLRPGISF